MRKQLTIIGMIAVLLVLSLIAFTVAAQDAPAEGATAALINADGENIGRVTFTAFSGKTLVTAELINLPPGFHGFHIHAVGVCDPAETGAFTTALGHITGDTNTHPSHAGDLSTLYVSEDGTAYLSVLTDYFTIDQILDDDGSAILVHANPDNFANIPERYGGPDQESLETGDSGDRIGCGVINAGGTDMMEMTPEATAAVG